jgi:hypothetical protein
MIRRDIIMSPPKNLPQKALGEGQDEGEETRVDL